MVRIARINAEGEAFYHVVSRIANKAFLLNNGVKIRGGFRGYSQNRKGQKASEQGPHDLHRMDGVMFLKVAIRHSGSLRQRLSCRKVRIEAALSARAYYRWGWERESSGMMPRRYDEKKNRKFESDREMVGAEGFEPSTFCSRSKRATRLRYAPTLGVVHAYTAYWT